MKEMGYRREGGDADRRGDMAPRASSGGCGGREGGSNAELPTQGQGHGTCAERVESQSRKIIRVGRNDLGGLFQPSPSRQHYLKGFGFPVGTPRRPLQISPFSPEVLVCNSTRDFTPIFRRKLFSTTKTEPELKPTGSAPHPKRHTAPLSAPSPLCSACKSFAHTLTRVRHSTSSTASPA